MSENDVPVSNQSDEDINVSAGPAQLAGTNGSRGTHSNGAGEDVDEEAIAQLDEALEKFVAQKRWSDVIKTTLAKAELVADLQGKVELYAEAGRLYLERSPNQSEAIKCFQRVLELDAQNQEAMARLKEMYEKRRDWERLVEIRKAEVGLLEAEDQLDQRVEIALLATERLRKPAICIDLWRDVLDVDPANEQALSALAGLYERAREWEPLARVLESQSESGLDEEPLVALLTKLGSVYSDKLGNDEGAISAYERLLALRPDDRRAQEQIKKRYVSARCWDELETFYEGTDKWEDLIRTLERAADSEGTSADEAVELQFRIARIWLEKRDKADRAARAYEKVLAADANNLQAAQALAPIYEAAGDAKRLVTVNDVRLAHTTDPLERVDLLRASARLYEQRLRAADQAFDCLLDAFAIDPADPDIQDDLERVATHVEGQLPRLFEAYTKAIDKARDPDDAADLRLRYGRLLRENGQIDEAIAALALVLEERPDDADAISALAELYTRSGRHEELRQILVRRAESSADPDERRSILYRIAALQRDDLKDADAAISGYLAILEEFGDGETDAYVALEELYAVQERWQELAESLQHRIDLGVLPDEELGDVKFRLAGVYLRHLGARERALEVLNEVLLMSPEHAGAIEMLEGLLDDPELGGDAARLLEPLYEESGNWGKLVRALGVSAAAADDVAHKNALLTRIGEIQAQQLGDGAAAYGAYAKAMTNNPGRADIAARLEELASEQERVPELVQLLLKLAGESADARLSRSLYLNAARLQDEELDQVDGAVQAYQRVLETEPGDPEVLLRLEGLYRRAERWQALMEVLRERALQSDDASVQEDLLFQVAFIHYEMLSDPAAAIRVYGEVLEVNPLSRSALSQLDRLYEAEGMWAELADNVVRQLGMADDEGQRISLMLRLAALRETRMGEVPGAIEIYREVLDAEPSEATALAALQRLLQQMEYQQQIAEVLEPIYRESGQYAPLVEIYEIQLHHSNSVDERVHLLHTMAQLQETALQDLNASFHCQARALIEEPANPDTQAELERLAATLNQWDSLAQVYESQAQRVEDAMLSAALFAKAAEIRESQLSDGPASIGLYRRVLELDPRNVDAASALERLYYGQENYEELAQVYLTKASMMEVPDDKREHLFRAAEIYEQILGRPEQAVAVYERSLNVEPDDVDALDRLIELRSRQGEWPELLEAYQKKADIIDDLDEKKAIYAQVGQVYEQRLEQPERAIEVYQRVLELDPQESVVIARLDALYESRGDWDGLLSILEKEAELAPDPEAALSFRYRIGELYETRLNQPYRAVDVYRDILIETPPHAPTVAALQRMVAAGQEPVAAAQVLEPVYRASGEAEPLVAVLEVLVAHDEDPLRKVELLQQIAELQEVHVGNAAAAFDALARALPYDAENEHTLLSLERLAEGLGAFDRLAALYDGVVKRLRGEDPQYAVELALRLAQIFEARIGDVDSAIQRYSIVIEQEPDHREALGALDRLYEATGRFAELTPVLLSQIENSTDPDEILEHRYRLGQVYQHQLGHVPAAVEQYREVLSLAPTHDGAMQALEQLLAERSQVPVVAEILEPLYRNQEAWGPLINLAGVQLETIDDAEDRVALIQRVVEIAEQRAGDPELAFRWAQQGVLEDPANELVVLEAERLAEACDGWAQLTDTYAAAAESAAQADQVDAAVAMGRRLSELYSFRLHDTIKAEESLRYVVGLSPRDGEALEALDRIYTESAAGEALATVLQRRIEFAEDTFDKVEFSYRLAEVLYNEVGRTEDAVQVLNHTLDHLDGEHEASLRLLQNIYTATRRWKELYACYERELKVALGDTMRSEILGRMAHIASAELGEPHKAVGHLRQVLELLGEEPAALNALGNLYALAENWTDLVDVLEREVAVTDDDTMRVAIYNDLGRIWYDKLSRDRNALDSWERVLDIDPNSVSALTSIAAVHRNAGAVTDLVDSLHRVLECPQDRLSTSQLEDVHVELGALYADRLNQPYEAVEQYRKALEVAPRNFTVMQALERIFVEQEQWEDCVALLHQRATAFEEPQARITVLMQVADLWNDKLEQPDGARAAYDEILQLDPEHSLAFERLETLHREAGRFDDLIELYIIRVESTEDAVQRVELLTRVAVVYEKDLDDKNQAFDALLLAWQQDFTNEATASALERVAGLTQRWNEVLTTANGALQVLRDSEPQDDAAQNAICLKCARWYAREGHPEYAIPYLQQVLSVDSTNRNAMLQMADLHRQMHDWNAYGQALNRLAEMTEQPEDKAAVFVRIGALHQEHLDAPEQAIQHYKAALAAVPGNTQALRALETLYGGQQQWDELVEVLRQRIDGLVDPDERRAAKIALAEVYEEQLSDPTKAIDQYRSVLGEDPDNLSALRGLERQHMELEQWPELLDVLEKQLQIVPNERDQVTLLMRIAGMWEDEFLKPERAAERLEEVLRIDPLHREALDALVRLYRVQRKWDELISAYERLVDVVDEPAARAELYGAIGVICRDQLKDPERAIDSYLNVLENDEESVSALNALSELYEERQDYQQALDTMERLTGLVENDEERVELYCKMGQLFESKVQDRASAIEYFQRATDIDNTHLPSLLSLRDIHLEAGDYHAAARVLERAADAEESSRKKSIMRVELGRIYELHLKEHEAAVEAFEQARALDPDNVEAALPLVDEYINAERHKDAEPLLQMLVRSAGRFDEAELQRLWFTYGECAEKLGDDSTAVKAFGRAFELDPQDLPSLMGVAAAHYRRKEWDEAFKYYQMVLVHHRDALSPDETTDAFYRLGVIKGELGDRRKALNMFEKALEEDPAHRPTLEAVLKLHEQAEEWEQVIHFKKRILDGCEEAGERFALFSDIGELWQGKLDNPAAAIEAFVEASELRPDDHKMLHRLLELYLKTAQWEAVIDVINRISAVDERPQVRAKNAYTIGVILRDELKDQKGALQHFNEALDLDSLGQLKAFEAINKILKGNWKELERAFRKMLHRISGQGEQDLEFNLWHNLGTLYRDRLSNMVAAAEAFAMASRLQPQNMQEHQILAEVYARVPGRLESAIAEHQILLKHDPNNESAYRTLYKLYFDARAYDKAWCVAATLNYLQRGDAEHRQFYEQYKADGPIRPRSRLTDELWVKELFHPDENLLVGKIFESVTPAMLQWHRVTDKRLDLKKKQEVTDLANTTIAMARTFGFVNQVFGLGFVPRLFVCPDRSMGLEFATTIPPASVCGNTLLSGVSPLDVIFVVGRHLAFYRPEHYIRTLLQTKDQLKLVLAAAMRIAGADIADANVENTAKELQANGRMQPGQLELLKKIGRRFADAGARADIKAWMRSTELTAARAGFLMCNDIGIAARMVQSVQPLGAVELSPRERVQDLVLFSVSENYFRLREALGITIHVG